MMLRQKVFDMLSAEVQWEIEGWKIIQKWEIEWSGRGEKCGWVGQTSIRSFEEFLSQQGI